MKEVMKEVLKEVSRVNANSARQELV